ncbi:hypothetical protein JOQ06_012857, partial [Pogonophryne albipinna]
AAVLHFLQKPPPSPSLLALAAGARDVETCRREPSRSTAAFFTLPATSLAEEKRNEKSQLFNGPQGMAELLTWPHLYYHTHSSRKVCVPALYFSLPPSLPSSAILHMKKCLEYPGAHCPDFTALQWHPSKQTSKSSPEFSAKKENPFTTSIKPPNKQIWINTNSFRLFRLAFTFRWFGITCFGRFRNRIPGREIPSAAATSMRVPESDPRRAHSPAPQLTQTAMLLCDTQLPSPSSSPSLAQYGETSAQHQWKLGEKGESSKDVTHITVLVF